MTTDALAPPLVAPGTAPAPAARLAALARREGAVLLTLAVFALGVVMVIPLTQVTQDGWLTLVSGRQLVDHGLFAPDSLTILTHGQNWIDQQWLAQLTFYGLASAGGFKLAMLVHFVLVVGSVGFALAVARKRGAGPLSTAWVGALSILVAAWGWQMRSQNLAYPLFVGVLALLMFDRGKLSRRVFWVLPMLALWANLHGSVLIGTLLVCLYAATSALQALRSERRFAIWVRCAALATGAVAAVFASPYAPSLIQYYRSILANKDIKLIMEWRPATDFSAEAYMFYALAAIGAYLVIRYRRRIQLFEALVLVVTCLAGFQAVRNIVWFDYAALMILPVALEATRPMRKRLTPSRQSPSVLFAPVALVVLAVVAISGLGRSDAWYQHQWSPAAVTAVTAEARANPGATVWATERFADWLLWKDPSLAGRVAYDARFEMIKHPEFSRIADFTFARGRNWHAQVDRYDLVVLSTRHNTKQIAAIRAQPGRRTVYTDDFVTVLGRSAAGRSASTSPTA